jgi:hypothetical protein
VLPAERGDVREEIVGHEVVSGAERVDGAGEIAGVPQVDGGGHEVEA